VLRLIQNPVIKLEPAQIPADVTALVNGTGNAIFGKCLFAHKSAVTSIYRYMLEETCNSV
jgi:hypothetical protein